MFILAGLTQIRNPMKAIIFFLSIASAGYNTAQNWSPILVNEKMNYMHSDSSYISNTIWVDSVETAVDNMIYHLNRIVKDVPDNPEIVLRNQPQFLLRQMEVIVEGIYTFNYPGEFTIKTLANPGENWIFNSENNITAEVSSISIEDVFGVQDSIKVISLSDGNEIRLSKNFGILKFADFENGGNYQLMGIQDTDYGESVPDFWDIFNFEVGDVFQTGEDAGNADGSGNIIRKLTITSKEIINNSYIYDYDGIYWCLYFDIGIGWGIASYNYSDSFLFTDSILHPANFYPGQIYILPYSYSGYGTGRVLTRAKIETDTAFNLVTKEFGMKEENYGFDFFQDDVFYEFDDLNDTLYRYDNVSILGQPGGSKGIGYGASVGLTYSNEGFFEYWSIKRLVGFIKDGDTVGTITPDSLLLTGINNLKDVNSEVLVYPNPTYKLVNFRFTELNKTTDQINIEIHNLQGQVLMQQTGVKNEIVTLNVESLEPGIYLYNINSNEMMIQQGKLVIQ
jgi:hypothetical protein